MIKKIEKISFATLLLLAMALTALAFVAKGCVGYYRDVSARKSGRLVTYTLSVEDFRCDGMRLTEDGWQTTDGDPQMIYSVNGLFTGIAYTADCRIYPGDVILYYSASPDADFSRQYRMYVSQDKTDLTQFRGKISPVYAADVRLDPTTLGGNVIDFGQIVINPPYTLADYLAVTPYTVLMFGIYSLLLAAILRFVQEFFTKKFE